MAPSKELVAVVVGVCLMFSVTALTMEVPVHQSRIIVRTAPLSKGSGEKKTILVRWTSRERLPEKVTIWAAAGYRVGDAVGVSDTGPFADAELTLPGAHEFAFDQLDRNHPQNGWRSGGRLLFSRDPGRFRRH
jgi:hypothetical protein